MTRLFSYSEFANYPNIIIFNLRLQTVYHHTLLNNIQLNSLLLLRNNLN